MKVKVEMTMKTKSKKGAGRRMRVRLASHYGMCFGVRDALRKTFDEASAPARERVTVLGQLVHNPVVDEELGRLRVERLTASQPRVESDAVRAALASGELDLVVGTHALILTLNLVVLEQPDNY